MRGPAATTLVWPGYPLPLVLRRLARPTLHRIIRCEELWNGNQESVRLSFFSRDSIFLWALTSHPRHRCEYPLELARPEYPHLASGLWPGASSR